MDRGIGKFEKSSCCKNTCKIKIITGDTKTRLILVLASGGVKNTMMIVVFFLYQILGTIILLFISDHGAFVSRMEHGLV